jgi:hypothetical protein
MFALYFNDPHGSRAFIAAVDDKHSALSMAKLLSRQDPREVLVVENRSEGDTLLAATFVRGALQIDEFDAGPAPARASQGINMSPSAKP